MESRRIAAAAIVAAALALGVSAAPVTREQLAAMARQKVDPAVMRAIVERDCVDFDVDAANASELSKVVPAAVIEAAIECRKRAATENPGRTATAPSVEPQGTPSPAPAAPAPATRVPAAREPAASAVPAVSQVRVRAIFIGESGSLSCACALDGRPVATLTKEAQGEFGQAVERSKIRRESGYVPAEAGRHAVTFVCDPGAQRVKVDVDLVAGERRTIEVGETALRHWKLRKIEKN